jgi:Ca-activated chloride channel family protein
MYQIDAYHYIYLLGILPLVWLLYALVGSWKRKLQSNFANPALLKELSPNRSRFKPTLKLILFSLALALMVFGPYEPQNWNTTGDR